MSFFRSHNRKRKIKVYWTGTLETFLVWDVADVKKTIKVSE